MRLRVLLKRRRARMKDTAGGEAVEDLWQRLEEEGWREHPLLPNSHWRYLPHRINQFFTPKNNFRFRLSTALDVLSDRAIPFKSLAQASRFIDKKFDGDTSANFAMFLEIQAAERREERYIWSEDASLPQGWKLRTAQGRTEKQFFLAPDGQQFSSRRQGYQHLIR